MFFLFFFCFLQPVQIKTKYFTVGSVLTLT